MEVNNWSQVSSIFIGFRFDHPNLDIVVVGAFDDKLLLNALVNPNLNSFIGQTIYSVFIGGCSLFGDTLPRNRLLALPGQVSIELLDVP